MSTWIILSWVGVAILTAVNIFLFIKLKSASEQMLKMAFPNAKNMNEALSQMQGMMGAARGASRPGKYKGGRANPYAQAGKARPQFGARGGDAQLKKAMELLEQMQKKK